MQLPNYDFVLIYENATWSFIYSLIVKFYSHGTEIIVPLDWLYHQCISYYWFAIESQQKRIIKNTFLMYLTDFSRPAQILWSLTTKYLYDLIDSLLCWIGAVETSLVTETNVKLIPFPPFRSMKLSSLLLRRTARSSWTNPHFLIP